MFAAIAAGLAGQILGGAIGNEMSRGDRDESLKITRDLYNKYAGLQIPEVDKMKLFLEEMASVGALTPEMESYVMSSAPSAIEGYSADPRLKDAMLRSLQRMQEVQETGMDAITRAEQANLLRQANANQMAQQRSILENQSARGMGGSGSELAAMLLGSQAGANRTSAESLANAASAYARRTEAAEKSSNMAKAMEDQAFGQAYQKAGLADDLMKFRDRTRQDIQTRNVGARNKAQEMNLSERQRIADSNVSLRNQQQKYNKELLQKKFDNELARLNGMGGSAKDLSKSYADKAAGTAKMWSTIGNAVGSAGAKYFGQEKPAAQVQTQVQPSIFDESEADELTPEQKARGYGYF